MFDRISVNHRAPSTHKHVHVTEQRAPTDDSVKLLREMEKAAEDKLISSHRIANNELSAEWCVFRVAIEQQRAVRLRIKINGVEHRISFDLDDEPRHANDQVVHLVAEKIAEKFTQEIILPALQKNELNSILKPSWR
jgi:hypothetical protein